MENKKYYYFFENEKLSIDESELLKMIEEAIITVLINDPFTMPLNVLFFKTIKEVKSKKPNIFVRHEIIQGVIDELLKKNVLGISEYQKYYIDYLDYQTSDVVGEGYFHLDMKKKNGFITLNNATVVEDQKKSNFAKSTHFVHKKNINGAEHGDYVKFAELIINIRKKKLKLNLKDAKILEVLVKAKKNKIEQSAEK